MKVLGKFKPIIGMIHVLALPGTPKSNNNVKKIIDTALYEAEIYKKAGIDAIAIENMHDVPYLKNVGPEIVATMAVISSYIKNNFDFPIGIQILAGANKEALAVAKAANLDFIRAEGFVFAHVADEGYIESCAGELLRYRKIIGAENILIFTDIKKKHSAHAITSDVDIKETAHAANFFMSDGLILTGVSTGKPADIKELKNVKESVKNLPILIGSGITYENVEKYLQYADGLIVGSYFKEDGKWYNPVSYEKVNKFMMKVRKIRENLINI